MPALPALGPRTALQPLPPELAGIGASIDAIYVHVPFCSTKCHYCDFYSVAGHLDRAPDYLDALARELALHKRHWGILRPRSVFIGGGTPTLLAPEHLERLLGLLQQALDLSAVQEFTVEANPNTFDAARARVLRAAGVNRMSFGAQSFNQAELQTLQRDHNPASVAVAFATARAAGIHNLNLDLIFGIPRQTLATWEHSLSQALALAPAHLSCYSLIYEPNTAMTARLAAGDFQRLDEDTELAMFETVYRRLQAAGFSRYETSNYAREGKDCAHNKIYWQAGNWLGFGPSAGSHVASPARASSPTAAWQWKNAGSLAHYLEALQPGAGQVPVTQVEALPRAKWAAAAAVFWLRLDQGLAYDEFQQRTGVDVRRSLESVLQSFAQQGFAELSHRRARITERGVAVSDHILKRVLAGLESAALATSQA